MRAQINRYRVGRLQAAAVMETACRSSRLHERPHTLKASNSPLWPGRGRRALGLRPFEPPLAAEAVVAVLKLLALLPPTVSPCCEPVRALLLGGFPEGMVPHESCSWDSHLSSSPRGTSKGHLPHQLRQLVPWETSVASQQRIEQISSKKPRRACPPCPIQNSEFWNTEPPPRGAQRLDRGQDIIKDFTS